MRMQINISSRNEYVAILCMNKVIMLIESIGLFFLVKSLLIIRSVSNHGRESRIIEITLNRRLWRICMGKKRIQFCCGSNHKV